MTESLFPLVVKNASVRKRGKTIVGPIDLTLEGGGVTILLGPNGSGKTTLLRMLHGLEVARGGEVQWAVQHQEAAKRQSFVFQTPIMLRRSVIENLSYPLNTRGLDKLQTAELAQRACEQIGLQSKAALNARLLSGGEKQKLAIARALITEPEVIFLDEPTTNLDGLATKEIEAILRGAIENGTKIIMATHDMGQAKRLASDVVFLYRGKIHEQQNARAFFVKTMTKEAEAYLNGDIVE